MRSLSARSQSAAASPARPFTGIFLDKYDLINWYFDKLLARPLNIWGAGPRSLTVWRKIYIYSGGKDVFAAAFRYDRQNSLREHDFKLILAFYENLIREKAVDRPPPEIHFLLEMYCQGSITMTVKWVLGGMDLTPSQFRASRPRNAAALRDLFLELHLLS